jgi:hypothetical protein
MYLGYKFNERATDKAHIRDIVRKANKVVRCVWGIGERKWGGDFKKRYTGLFTSNNGPYKN